MSPAIKHSFQMQSRQEGEEMIVYLEGIIDQHGGTSLWESMNEADNALEWIVLNLTDVRLVTSAGLGILVQIVNFFKKSGRQVKFVNPSVPVRRVMELTHIDQMAVIE